MSGNARHADSAVVARLAMGWAKKKPSSLKKKFIRIITGIRIIH
jgi:hypothetical protein